MNTVLKAGVIVVRSGPQEPEALLVFRGKHDDWSFPKGHCEAGESFEETAVRETLEETGLSVRLVQSLPDMEYTDGMANHVVVGMFLGALTDTSQKERIEYETDRVEWIPLSRVEATLSYQNLREYFLRVQDVIRGESSHA